MDEGFMPWLCGEYHREEAADDSAVARVSRWLPQVLHHRIIGFLGVVRTKMGQ